MAYATSYPLATTGTPVSTIPAWYGGAGVFYAQAIGSGTAVLQWSPDDGVTWFDVPETSLTALGYKKFAVPLGMIQLKPTGSTGVTASVAPNPGATGLNDLTVPGSSLTVTSPPLSAGTDRSGSITTGGTAQTLAPANASRRSLTGQNISDVDMWFNETGGTAAAGAAGSFRIPAGSAFSVATNRAVSIVGATAGKIFTATET